MPQKIVFYFLVANDLLGLNEPELLFADDWEATTIFLSKVGIYKGSF